MEWLRSDVKHMPAPPSHGSATLSPRAKLTIIHKTTGCGSQKGPYWSHWAQHSNYAPGKTKAPREEGGCSAPQHLGQGQHRAGVLHTVR